ncbi:MAG: KEOPS complex subunit Pcc1 [Halobacteriales archaeon]|nr:KEOPS complex subunit Pcc1 [Halobacteriales archaeon]
MSRPHTATLVFEYADETAARLVASSVEQELDDIEGERTHATLSQSAAVVEVQVEADDLTALRAGINTWFSLVEVAESVAEV